MSNFFDIHVSKDRLRAEISLKTEAEEAEVTVAELNEMLKQHRIVFGIKEDVLAEISTNLCQIDFPIIIAEGIEAENGRDGYLINKAEVEEDSDSIQDESKAFNLRNVMKIKSVKNGQLLAQIINPTVGIPGKDVYGQPVRAKNGKPLRLRAGKNVIFHMNNIFATIDGQIAITPTTINVFPIFEVNGDLDLKTGNIDFIGNVVIRGNVPTGYTIKAGGDIKITGLVEGAILIAGGSISISGGVAGGYRGSLEAGVDITANYLNQAKCVAGRDIIVESYIMHSTISSGRNVFSRRGHIIGGEISAMESVEATDFGNQHYMQTVLYVGTTPMSAEREIEIHKELQETYEAIRKLKVLFDQIKRRKQAQGYITEQDKIILKKQQITLATKQDYLMELEQELSQLKGESNIDQNVCLTARGTIYPNTQIHFGKYSKPIQNKLNAIKIYLEFGEVITAPL